MAAQSSKKPTLTSLQSKAKELLALARDPSASARTALVSGLYDLSHAGAELPSGASGMAVELVLKIIESAQTSVRQQLSERLARDPKAPKNLVLALARDHDVSVAYPILIESPVLQESDLVDLLRDSPAEHRLGTLQRETLSESVASVAVKTGDPTVMRWLVENPGAEISRRDMEVIVQAAQVEPVLQQPLVHRADLPTDLAEKMHAYLPDELRQEMFNRHPLDRTKLRSGAATPSNVTPTAELERRALALALEQRTAGNLTTDLLVKTLRTGKLAEFEALLARFCSISLQASQQLLASPTGDGLAVALKARGVDKANFATLFILSRKSREPAAEMTAALARATDAFDRLPITEAAKRLAALQAAHPEDSAP
jgi:uncharacterized protein (DUF2336 family)